MNDIYLGRKAIRGHRRPEPRRSPDVTRYGNTKNIITYYLFYNRPRPRCETSFSLQRSIVGFILLQTSSGSAVFDQLADDHHRLAAKNVSAVYYCTILTYCILYIYIRIIHVCVHIKYYIVLFFKIFFFRK